MVLDLVLYTIIFFLSALLVRIISGAIKPIRSRLPPSPISLPIIGHLHLLDIVPYKSFHKLATKYGPFFHLRLGSVPCIVISSPELTKELMATNELTFAARPVTMAIDHLTYNSSAFAFAPYGAQWKFMKKICMTELLSGRALNQLYPIRKEELLLLVQVLVHKSSEGETVNLSEALVNISNNIISRMMWGATYSGKDDQAKEARVLIREVTQIFGTFNLSDFIWLLRKFDIQGLLKKSKDARKRYNVMIERIIKEREEFRTNKKLGSTEGKADGGVKDFLDILLDISEDDNAEMKLNRDHIKAFILDIFTAGTDTSAALTEWAMSELINNPKILDKARKEIDSVVTGRMVEESDLPNLPYIHAIYKEALRLHPPVPMLPREASQECKVAGYDIPAKTNLFVNLWSIQRDPNNWKDPLEFKPERFMQLHDDQVGSFKEVRGQQYDLLPFGTGRRGCPGASLVLQQAPAMLAALIQCFDWEVAGHDDGIKLATVDMIERPGLTVPRANALLLVPTTRFNPFTDTVVHP
uniref:Putative flavone synthase II n=1 Tax=Epimedium sagittatum TaxID=253616 RepID=A0A0A7DMP2_9MAGN|nr:putative flavone synthase II [Epimedium sagittatum]